MIQLRISHGVGVVALRLDFSERVAVVAGQRWRSLGLHQLAEQDGLVKQLRLVDRVSLHALNAEHQAREQDCDIAILSPCDEHLPLHLIDILRRHWVQLPAAAR